MSARHSLSRHILIVAVACVGAFGSESAAAADKKTVPAPDETPVPTDAPWKSPAGDKPTLLSSAMQAQSNAETKIVVDGREPMFARGVRIRVEKFVVQCGEADGNGLRSGIHGPVPDSTGKRLQRIIQPNAGRPGQERQCSNEHHRQQDAGFEPGPPTGPLHVSR